MRYRNFSRPLKWTVAGVAAAGLLASAGAAGFASAYIIEFYQGPVFAFADRVGNGLARRWKKAFRVDPFAPGDASEVRFSSIFVPLQGEIVEIPGPGRSGAGGGVTSWDDHVVVMTHEGRIYLVAADKSVTLSRIEAPFNGFAEYLAAAELPPLNEYQHSFQTFRYNDITHFQTEEGRGLLVSYTRFHQEETCFTTTVSRLYIDARGAEIRDHAAAAADWEDVFETRPCLPPKRLSWAVSGHMAGGRMAFDGMHTVYLASGDYSWDGVFGPRVLPERDPDAGPAVAQDPTADYGKVIAIDLRSGEARQVSRGHRNMQGIALDRAGRVWTIEHGHKGGDELNLNIEGENYGWPLVTYGVQYSGLPIADTPSLGRHEGFRRPAIAWLPSIAPSGLTRVENFHEAWDGDLLATTLAGQKLVRIRVADDRAIFAEYIETGRRLRDVHQHADGRLVLWTDLGEVILLAAAPGGLRMEHVKDHLAGLGGDAALARRVHGALLACTQCHSIDPGDHANAPSLADVFNAPAGATGFGGYSEALRKDGRIWTRDQLAAYLRDPQATVPGTKMPDPGVDDERVIDELIEILHRLATES